MDKSAAGEAVDASPFHFAEVTFGVKNCPLASGSKWSGMCPAGDALL